MAHRCITSQKVGYVSIAKSPQDQRGKGPCTWAQFYEAPLADSFSNVMPMAREMLTTSWSPTFMSLRFCGFLALTISSFHPGLSP